MKIRKDYYNYITITKNYNNYALKNRWMEVVIVNLRVFYFIFFIFSKDIKIRLIFFFLFCIHKYFTYLTSVEYSYTVL